MVAYDRADQVALKREIDRLMVVASNLWGGERGVGSEAGRLGGDGVTGGLAGARGPTNMWAGAGAERLTTHRNSFVFFAKNLLFGKAAISSICQHDFSFVHVL